MSGVELFQCRTCLNYEPLKNCHDLFTDKYALLQTLASVIVRLCDNVQITKDDGHTHKICKTCTISLNKAMDFKEKCEMSHQILQSLTDDVNDTSNIERLDDVSYELVIRDDTHIKADMEKDVDEIPMRINDDNVELLTDDCCVICMKSYSDEAMFRQHVVQKHLRVTDDLKVYPCVDCGRDFGLFKELVSHTIKTHSQDASQNRESLLIDVNVTCVFCMEDFPNANELQLHVTNEHPREENPKTIIQSQRLVNEDLKDLTDISRRTKRIRCMLCDKIFFATQALSSHIKHDHEIFNAVTNRFEIDCKYCTKKFKSYTIMREHVREIHLKTSKKPLRRCLKKKMYTCLVCEQTYLGVKSISSHALNTHQQQKDDGSCYLPCPWCEDDNVGSYLQLQTHVQKVHPDELHHNDGQKYACPHCHEQYHNRFIYQRHLRTHDKFECSKCNKLFTHQHRLDNHQSTCPITREPLCCEKCGKKFAAPKLLRSHMANTHREGLPFVCRICERGLKTKLYLKRHMMRHERPNAKKYVCTICAKAYNTEQYLKRHVNYVHLSKGRFRCDECNRDFVDGTVLRRHLFKYHSDG